MVIKVDFPQEKFDLEIEELVEKGLSIIEAIVMWCEINSIETELIAGIIKKNVELKNRISEIAIKFNLLKN